MNTNPTFDYNALLLEHGYNKYDSCGCGGTKNDKYKKGLNEITYQPLKNIFIHKNNGRQLAFKNSWELPEYLKTL